jgi:hypothetical protein
VAWWLRTYERVQEELPLPRTGEAATHPLFALRVALEADGRRARTSRRLDPRIAGPRDTLVYDGDPSQLAQAEVDALLRWVRGGGHLVIPTPPANAAVDTLHRGRRPDATHLPAPLLDALGVRARLGPPACLRLKLGNQPQHDEFCAGRRFDAPATARARWGDAKGDVFARLPVGTGHVDVLAQMDFLTTDALDECTHVAMARQLVARMDRGGTVHLVHAGAVPSLWGWLLREAWRVWLPLALLLTGWLWMRMRRFGPLQPSPVLERRSLMEHVAASGEHQWRYGDGDRLYGAMREAFLARLRQRDPQAAALTGAVQVERLADRLGEPQDRIVDALTPPASRDASALLARIAFLVRMRNRL